MSDDSSPSRSGIGPAAWLTRLFQGGRGEEADRSEIARFLADCRASGILAGDEYAMLLGVLDVSETHVREIMVPRSHMVVLPDDGSLDEILKLIIESGHSRFPIIGQDRDEVVGILLAKDLLKQVAQGNGEFDLKALMRPTVFIPESKRLNTLLTEFRESHNHMAIVVDEYGGVSGLATIEDVIEQIVGEIDDEHDREEAEYIQQQEDGRCIVRGLTRIEDFNAHFGVDIDDAEYETVGGLVMHELGRLPRRGETVECRGFRFQVLRADRRRIHSLEVTRLPPQPVE